MLDVYRSYYGLSGEPFRLGPDYRFSLHHTSYANAKAYLDYAIYQGEGFIAITGEPGTGKTTLISEILATLDRTRVQVATLTSTQLESRDLLHMVASSFGMQPDRFDKADLLLEIEAYLVKKLRNGQRAMLIVDEAQGLSSSALEELRLLANMQYQYQLLLQICLVGQKNLLDLIHAPGMEHLQQRLVAATSLEPLGFDETIDYIEHRLGKVGWKGDPSIDEAALRLIYRYSRGTPRRINLIVNRLFLYGGMEEKHRLVGADAENVIAGLMEEHLLGSHQPLDESAITAPEAGKQAKPRNLPRPGVKKPLAPDAPATPSAGGKRAAPQTKDLKWDSDNLPGSRPQARQAGKSAQAPEKPAAGRQAADDTTQVRGRQPSFSARSPEPPPASLHRPRRPAPQAPVKKNTGKNLAMLVLFLIGAGGIYYTYTNLQSTGGGQPIVGKNTAVETLEPDPLSDASERAFDITGNVDDTRDAEAVAQTEEGGVEGDIVRTQPPGTGDADSQDMQVTGEEGIPETADDAISGAETETSPTLAAADETPPPAVEQAAADLRASAGADKPEADQTAVESPALQTAMAESVRTSEPEPQPLPATGNGDRQTPASAPAPTRSAVDGVAAEPAAARAGTASSATSPAAALPGDSIASRREKLRQEAERRFSSQLAQIKPQVAPAPVKTEVARPPVRAVTAPVVAPAPVAVPEPPVQVAASQPKTSTSVVKKKPLTTARDVKAILLSGRWNSSNKPASLLPSESTFCDDKFDGIHCVSVPQNVKTQYGLALYKVESKLSGFSSEGLFEMSYKTLVKLVGTDADGKQQTIAGPSENGWQVTEYAMSCKLAEDNRVSCLDGKGITREYRRQTR